jgi:hypothetical protein
MLRLPHFVDNQLTDGAEVVNLTGLWPFIPRKIPGTHFCQSLSQLHPMTSGIEFKTWLVAQCLYQLHYHVPCAILYIAERKTNYIQQYCMKFPCKTWHLCIENWETSLGHITFEFRMRWIAIFWSAQKILTSRNIFTASFSFPSFLAHIANLLLMYIRTFVSLPKKNVYNIYKTYFSFTGCNHSFPIS